MLYKLDRVAIKITQFTGVPLSTSQLPTKLGHDAYTRNTVTIPIIIATAGRFVYPKHSLVLHGLTSYFFSNRLVADWAEYACRLVGVGYIHI